MSLVEHQLRDTPPAAHPHPLHRRSVRLRHSRGYHGLALAGREEDSLRSGTTALDQRGAAAAVVVGSHDPVERLEPRLIGSVLDGVVTLATDTIKSVTDLLGLTKPDEPAAPPAAPPTAPPANGGGGGNSPTSTSQIVSPTPSPVSNTQTSEAPNPSTTLSSEPASTPPNGQNAPTVSTTTVAPTATLGLDDTTAPETEEGEALANDTPPEGDVGDIDGNSGLGQQPHGSVRPAIGTPESQGQSLGGDDPNDPARPPILSTVTYDDGRTSVIVVPWPTATGTPTPGVNGGSGMTQTARIAVSTTVTLGLLAALAALFFIRKRKIQKREKEQKKRRNWWFNKRRRTSRDYSDEKPVPPMLPVINPVLPAESSTTAWRRSDNMSSLPAIPQMAEIRKASSSTASMTPQHPQSIPSSAKAEESRFSVGSLISFGSSNEHHSIVIENTSIRTGSDFSCSQDGSKIQRQSFPPPVGAGLSILSSPTFSQIQFPVAAAEIQPPAEAVIDRTAAYYSNQPHSPGLLARSPSLSSSIADSQNHGQSQRFSTSTGTAESGTISLDLGFGPSRSDLALHTPSSNAFFPRPTPSKYDDALSAGDVTRHAVGQSMSSTLTNPYPPGMDVLSPLPSVQSPPIRQSRVAGNRLSAFGIASSATPQRADAFNPFSDFSTSSPYGMPNFQDRRPYSIESMTSSQIERDNRDSGDVSIIASSCYEPPARSNESRRIVSVSFIGSLSDELSVGRGDEVRVVKVYQDGWALVERGVRDDRAGDDAERGLVPLAVLQQVEGGTPRWSALGMPGEVGEVGERVNVVYPARVDSYTARAGSLRSL